MSMSDAELAEKAARIMGFRSVSFDGKELVDNDQLFRGDVFWVTPDNDLWGHSVCIDDPYFCWRMAAWLGRNHRAERNRKWHELFNDSPETWPRTLGVAVVGESLVDSILAIKPVQPVHDTEPFWRRVAWWVIILFCGWVCWMSTCCAPETVPVVIGDTGDCCDLPVVRLCAFQSHEQPCDPCPGGGEYDAAGRRAK